jgi:hypothetical protein
MPYAYRIVLLRIVFSTTCYLTCQGAGSIMNQLYLCDHHYLRAKERTGGRSQ